MHTGGLALSHTVLGAFSCGQCPCRGEVRPSRRTLIKKGVGLGRLRPREEVATVRNKARG